MALSLLLKTLFSTDDIMNPIVQVFPDFCIYQSNYVSKFVINICLGLLGRNMLECNTQLMVPIVDALDNLKLPAELLREVCKDGRTPMQFHCNAMRYLVTAGWISFSRN